MAISRRKFFEYLAAGGTAGFLVRTYGAPPASTLYIIKPHHREDIGPNARLAEAVRFVGRIFEEEHGRIRVIDRWPPTHG